VNYFTVKVNFLTYDVAVMKKRLLIATGLVFSLTAPLLARSSQVEHGSEGFSSHTERQEVKKSCSGY
jgi:hypothetical protein